jgi:hypothetical protein
MTFFSGRRAPPHPGGVPNVGDWVNQEAYTHACSSTGLWPGGGPMQEPVFYACSHSSGERTPPPRTSEAGIAPHSNVARSLNPLRES